MTRCSRLDIIMNQEMTAVLDEITKEDRIPRHEVIVKAVAYYRILRDQRDQGKKVLLSDENGENLKELLLY